MKHNFKKIISILLVVVMCLGAFPVGIFAEGDVHNHADETATVVKCPACQTTDKVAVDHVVENATCTDAAGTWYVCTDDVAHATSGGRYLWLVQTAPALHANGANLDVNTEHVDATCTDDGVKASWICSVDAEGACGKLFIEDAEGNPVATNVDLTDEAAVAAALKIAADDSYNANINEGDSEVEEYHDFGEWTEVQKFQCGVKDGIWERVCSICGDKQTKTKDKDEHNFDWTAEFEKLGSITCTQEVTVTVTCKNAGCDATATRNVYGWNHDYIAHSGDAPDCLNPGQWDYYSCKHCNKLWVDGEDENSNPIKVEIANMSMTIIPAVGHDFEGAAAVNKEYKAPTCTEDGNYEYHICAVCHEVLKSDDADETEVWTQDTTTLKWGYEIDKLGHEVSETITAVDPATCTEEGYEAHYKCTRCDAKFSVAGDPTSEITGSALDALVIAKIPHVFGSYHADTTKNCTAGTVGTYEYITCGSCNQKFSKIASTLETGKHELAIDTIDETVIAALTGEDGPAKTAAQEAVAAVLVDANIVTNVAQYFKWPSATVLNGFDWVTVAPEGHANESHDWIPVAHLAPTCTTNGYSFWRCADCDDYTSAEKNYITWYNATNHAGINAESNIVAYKAANCVENGNVAYARCPSVCGKYYKVVDGVADTTTPYDNTTFFELLINGLNHKAPVVKGTDVDPATHTEDGIRAYSHCTACGKYFTGTNNTDAVKNYDTEAAAKTDPKHTQTEHAKVMPTCVADGNVKYWSCSCEKNFADAACTTELTADEVKYTLAEALAAEDAGLVNNGHTIQFVDLDPAKCYKDGTAAHYKCTAGCGKLFSDANGATETTLAALTITDRPDHTYDNVYEASAGEVAPDPCKGDGTYLGLPGISKCTVAECGHLEVVTQHKFTIKIEDEAPTCETKGKWHLECEVCGSIEIKDGKKVVYQYEEYRSHVEMGFTHVARVEATCVNGVPTAGNIEYWTCNECDKIFDNINMTHEVTSTVIAPAHDNHTDAFEVTDSLTVCNPAGTVVKINQHKCTKCEKYYTVAADGTINTTDAPVTETLYHTAVLTGIYTPEQIANSAATCLTPGYVQRYECSGCGKVFEDIVGTTEDTSANPGYTAQLSHASTGVHVPEQPSTCITQGTKAYIVCTNGCNGKFDFTYTETDGYTLTTQFDDTSIKLPLVNHTTVLVPGDPSYCTSKDTVHVGTADTYRCTVEGCGKLFTTENPAYNAAAITEAPAVAHTANFTQHVELPPLCADWGYDSFTCTCGYVYYVFTHPLGHTVVNKNETYQAPTCVNPGKENYYYCTTCAMSYADAACTQVKYKVAPNPAQGIAAVYYTDDTSAIILATGDHRNVDNAPLRTNCVNDDGSAYLENIAVTDRFCTSCEQNIYITNHIPGSATIEGGSTPANCQSPASEFKICTACDQVIPGTQTYTGEKDPDAHVTVKADASDNWVVVDEVACGENGLEHLVCVLCDTVVDQRITTRAHDFTDTTNWVYTESICGVQGYITKTCAHAGCGAINTEQKLPALATTEHDFENVAWIIDDTKAFDSDKSEYRICANADCDHKEYRQRQDVKFTVSIDNAIVPGAVVVNSGTIAVTIKLSANNRPVNALTFSFQASNNLALVYDGDEAKVDTTALADNFNWLDIGVDNNNIVTVSAIMASLTGETTVDGINVEFITLYFKVANDEPAISDTVYAAPINDAIIIDGNNASVDTTVGLVYSKPVYYLGDFSLTKDSDDNPVVGDGNGTIDLYDVRAMMTIIFGDVEYSYDARADVNKDGIVDMVDFAAIRKFNTDRDYYKLINVAS